MKRIRRLGARLHYFITALLAILLLPLLEHYHLPIRFDWRLYCFSSIYFGAQGVFLAILLYGIHQISGMHIRALIGLLRKHNFRILLSVAYLLLLTVYLSWLQALVIGLDTIFLAGWAVRPDSRKDFRRAIFVLIPAIYFVAALILISSYNDIIASTRNFGAYDQVFNSFDKSLLHGFSVALLAQLAAQQSSFYFFRFLEVIYYGLFPIMAAGLFLIGFQWGRRREAQFVGAILTSYYISLLVYYIWPSLGPFYLDSRPLALLAHPLGTHALQVALVERARSLLHPQTIREISFDYLIAFPCMHITQSLIVLWFMRRWRKVYVLLGVYNVVLVVAIILLEWHYVVDILAGIVVAAIAIAVIEKSVDRNRPETASGVGNAAPKIAVEA